MSSFEVRAYKIEIEPHPDPEVTRIELAKVGGYVSVVQKGQYQTGDIALYIPEQAIVPLEILKEMNLTKEKDGEIVGGLAGSEGRRVKAMRLRGVLSQGLIYDCDYGFGALELDKDYAEALNITKWEPPIPPSLAGQVKPHPKLRTYTDIENIKKYMDVFTVGEEVIVTEKLHGTCCIGSLVDGEFVVSSKGLAGRGLGLERDEIENGRTKNIYWRAMESISAEAVCKDFAEADEVTLFGEVLGVQDLMYGHTKGDFGFRLFDIRVNGTYLSHTKLENVADDWCINMVPILYKGPFDYEVIKELAEGQSTIATHMREGVVVRPVVERQNEWTGRTILKAVGEGYLTRKGNTTEYE